MLGDGAFDSDIHPFVIRDFQENDLDQNLVLGTVQVGNHLADKRGGLVVANDKQCPRILVHVEFGRGDLAVGRAVDIAGAGGGTGGTGSAGSTAAGAAAESATTSAESTATATTSASLLSQERECQATEADNRKPADLAYCCLDHHIIHIKGEIFLISGSLKFPRCRLQSRTRWTSCCCWIGCCCCLVSRALRAVVVCEDEAVPVLRKRLEIVCCTEAGSRAFEGDGGYMRLALIALIQFGDHVCDFRHLILGGSDNDRFSAAIGHRQHRGL